MLIAILVSLSVFLQPQQIVVGVDPGLWDITVAGAAGWEEAGAADFVFVEGCGNGTLNVCYGDMAIQPPGAVSTFIPAWYQINVYLPGMYTVAVACQELGHALGLWYHRSDYASCMSDPIPTVAYPDAIDLENLGITITPPDPVQWAPLHDGTGGPYMPL